MQSQEVEPQSKLVEKEFITIDLEIGVGPQVAIHNETTKI
jgi:hypothetical protein